MYHHCHQPTLLYILIRLPIMVTLVGTSTVVSGLASNNTSPNKLPNHFHLTLLAIYQLVKIVQLYGLKCKKILTKFYRSTAAICGSAPTTCGFLNCVKTYVTSDVLWLGCALC